MSEVACFRQALLTFFHAPPAIPRADNDAEQSQDDDRPLRTGLTIKLPKYTDNPFHFKKRRGVHYCAVCLVLCFARLKGNMGVLVVSCSGCVGDSPLSLDVLDAVVTGVRFY